MIHRWLFTQIDNSALLLFRIFFGFLIAAEAFGAICTGWVKITLVDPQFTFNFIGLDFLQPLPGHWMYAYFALMGTFGIAIMLGYRYRMSCVGYTLMWAGVYFMQKSSYNNHYYLLLLLLIMMCFLPAADHFSLDSHKHPEKAKIEMPQWCVIVIILQLWIVYTYAATAKLYPDWLDHTVVRNLMQSRINYPIIGALLQESWVHACITYFGIAFDFLIIPLLLYRRTRMFAFGLSVFFHIFNSIVFQIGIFPYLSLAFTVFFIKRKRIHRVFRKVKPFYSDNKVVVPNNRNTWFVLAGIWFWVQLVLPIRHWAIPGDVLWTEEGHRLSWRMMLRSRSGNTKFYVVDRSDPLEKRVLLDKSKWLSAKQNRLVSTRPDAIWQFAQRIKSQYALKGKDVKIYVDSKVSVNAKPAKRLIDATIDLAQVPWEHFRTNPWVLKY